MKKQILTLIIGILIGAIIATGVFLVLNLSNNKGDNMQQKMREAPSMDGNSIQQKDGEPPARPGESTTNSTSTNSNTSNT